MLQLGSSVKILEVSMSATVLGFQCALIKKTRLVALTMFSKARQI